MLGRRDVTPWLWCGVAGLLACGPPAPKAAAGETPEPTVSAESAPTAPADRAPKAPDPDAPASQRLLGTWRLDLATVPDVALSDDLRRLKQQGVAAQMQVEYTFKDGEFTLDKRGPGGRIHRRWFYEILEEDGDKLMLQRTDDSGQTQKIPASVTGGMLKLGQGKTLVVLVRAG